VPTLPDGWTPRSPNQVIGESEADGAFIRAVAAAHNVPDFEFTAPKGEDGRSLGKDGFKKHLLAMSLFTQRGLVERIVIVGDNDTDHARALADVRKSIREAKAYPTPVPPLQAANGNGLRVGIIMLPGIGENGCLESLLMKANRLSGPSAACLDAWIACSAFPTHPRNPFDKFQIRSILAAAIVGEPNVSIERMWQKSDNPINADDPAFSWIADFLAEMFSP
jgi:hypothetical protein